MNPRVECSGSQLRGAGNDSGCELDQLRVLAPVQRQFGDFALIHYLPAFARFRLQLCGFGGGDDRRSCLGDAHLDIHSLVRPNCQIEPGHGRLKSLCRYIQLIGADRDGQETGTLPVIGAGRRFRFSGCVVQYHLAVGYDCTAGVGHGSKHSCCIELRLCTCRQ